MSQVIVTPDKYAPDRERTRLQEQRINREGAYARWRLGDVTKMSLVEKLVGYGSLPVLAFWALIMAGLGYAVGLSASLFRILAGLFR